MKFTPNLVVGVAITILGSVLLLDRLDMLEIRQVLHLWPILLTLFGISIIVQAWKGDTAPFGAPAGRPIVGPGLVLFLVVVTILATRVDGRRFTPVGAPTDSDISVVGIMGRDERVSTSPALRGGSMTTVMGRTRLDLRQATLAPTGEAVIDVFGMMGSVDVLVPEEWTVDVQAWAIMGGVQDRRKGQIASREREKEQTIEQGQTPALQDRGPDGSSRPEPATPSAGATAQQGPKLVIRGTVVMGGLVVRLW
jgi:hypothetical protein